ncbi:MAG: glutamine synthetase [Kordiimonadaceae bacterium]|nr:glutamine synthetase [Kordiimonadaceae bacterium]MBT6035884.1 glutamine synthetase [Kordiimonadaceae bacterium]MBT6330917.1 glutamine synthetase [Kordiimonadaceae bacterium]
MMNVRDVRTAEDAKKIVIERDVKSIKIAVSDIDGILRGKYISRDKFLSALEGNIAFCDVVLGWDMHDELYENTVFTGWHTAYPDADIELIYDSCREAPFEDNVLFFLAEFVGRAGAVCPRNLLGRVMDKAKNMGYGVTSAYEFEFFVFDETPHSVRDKNYRDLTNFTPGNFGYSVLRSSVHNELYHEILEMCRDMDMEIEGLHTETGPGVLEAALKYDAAMNSADKAILFKTFIKTLAQRNGLMATFMAKWSVDYPGQSGHIHISLQDENGGGVFYDKSKPDNISDEMRWFIGGQQKLMPELLAMVASNINSYARLVPGHWAPTDATWGVENRTCALRTIGGSENSTRVEYRISASDINPYIAGAAAIGSGLWGIENKIEPTEPIAGNAYDLTMPPEFTLPSTLDVASEKLKTSEIAKELFGDEFIDHYSRTRDWEVLEARKAVTDWQLQRYFEII